MINHPYIIVADVLVKVDKFMFLANFIVLDTDEDADITLLLENLSWQIKFQSGSEGRTIHKIDKYI